MEVLVNVLIEESRVSDDLLSFIVKSGQRIMRIEGCLEEAELSVVLTDDDQIKELNTEYRGIATPTDVLSFPQEDEYILGDVIISLPTAQRQALQGGRTLNEELCVLLIHGILHLLGYDHEEDNEAEAMEAREAQILLKLGDLFDK